MRRGSAEAVRTWLTGLALLGASACGQSSLTPQTGTATYSISGTELMVFDSVKYSDGVSQLISEPAPVDGWSRTVGFSLPGQVAARLYLIALGAGQATLRVSWSVDGVVHRDSAVAMAVGPGTATLTIPLHVVTAP